MTSGTAMPYTMPAERSRGLAGSKHPVSTEMIHFPPAAGSCSDCISRECCLGSRLAAADDTPTTPLVKHKHTLGYCLSAY